MRFDIPMLFTAVLPPGGFVPMYEAQDDVRGEESFLGFPSKVRPLACFGGGWVYLLVSDLFTSCAP
jgi:hypothetical protein